MQHENVSYRPAAIGNFLLAEYFQEPEGCTSDLQIVHSGIPHSGRIQIGT